MSDERSPSTGGTTMGDAPTPAEPSWAKPSIAIFSLALFALALAVVWWANKDAAFNLLIGAVISNATTVIGYYFGSSSGSAQKTSMIAGLPRAALRGIPPAPVAHPAE